MLEGAQIKVSSVVSDLFGVSGRAFLAAPVAASRTPTFLGARSAPATGASPSTHRSEVEGRGRRLPQYLEIAWHLIGNPQTRFADLGSDWHERHLDQDRRTRQRIHAPAA